MTAVTSCIVCYDVCIDTNVTCIRCNSNVCVDCWLKVVYPNLKTCHDTCCFVDKTPYVLTNEEMRGYKTRFCLKTGALKMEYKCPQCREIHDVALPVFQEFVKDYMVKHDQLSMEFPNKSGTCGIDCRLDLNGHLDVIPNCNNLREDEHEKNVIDLTDVANTLLLLRQVGNSG